METSPHRSDPANVAALRRELAGLIRHRQLTDELAIALAHYRATLLVRGDDLSADIARVRAKIRIAEWRLACGRLPRHLELLARAA